MQKNLKGHAYELRNKPQGLVLLNFCEQWLNNVATLASFLGFVLAMITFGIAKEYKSLYRMCWLLLVPTKEAAAKKL